MRLTLRTLLAWMDDTLTAAEVREIGKQLSESPYARELAERINKVARQRRLTVPGDTPPDGIDPALVAAYLDNELAPEAVADYEKLCLKSDVSLAEVASVHQILSLIGQKAKVPPEARHRMYRLVKGREASRSRAARAFAPSHDQIETQAPVRKPVSKAEWGAPGSSRASTKSFSERFGLPAAVLGLMGILIFAAVKSLETDESHRPVVQTSPTPVPGSQPVVVTPPKTNPDAERIAAKEAAAAAKKQEEEKAKAAENPAPVATEKAADPSIAKVEKSEGLILVASSVEGPWKPLDPKVDLKSGEFVLNLTPTWTTIRLGKVSATLQGVGMVGLAPAEAGKPAKLRLEQGRVVLRDLERSEPFDVLYRGKVLAILGATAASFGLEVRPPTLAGTADVAPPSLFLAIPDGEASLLWGSATSKLSGASSISILPSDQLAEHSRGAVPAWVTDTAPSAFDSQITEQLLKSIRPGRPIVTSLVESLEEDNKDVRRLAIGALAGLGNAEMIVPILNETSDSATRKAAVEAIRTLLSRDSATRKVVRGELEKAFGTGAEVTEKLLAGYTPEEMKEEATMVGLIQLLSAPALGTRALAIETLRTMTGRDSMEYDPAMPEGKGLNNWKELVMKKESRKAVGGERVPAPPQAKSR